MKQSGSAESMAGKSHQVKVTREFDCPREVIFGMVTDPKKAVKWFGSPEGAVKLDFELDARPGGKIKLQDRHSDGTTFQTTGTFVEVLPPERISFTTATKPEGGSVPFEALQTMIFEEIGPRRTRLTVLVEVLAAGEVPGGVESLVEGYRGGWGDTLEMLRTELRSD